MAIKNGDTKLPIQKCCRRLVGDVASEKKGAIEFREFGERIGDKIVYSKQKRGWRYVGVGRSTYNTLVSPC